LKDSAGLKGEARRMRRCKTGPAKEQSLHGKKEERISRGEPDAQPEGGRRGRGIGKRRKHVKTAKQVRSRVRRRGSVSERKRSEKNYSLQEQCLGGGGCSNDQYT